MPPLEGLTTTTKRVQYHTDETKDRLGFDFDFYFFDYRYHPPPLADSTAKQRATRRRGRKDKTIKQKTNKKQ